MSTNMLISAKIVNDSFYADSKIRLSELSSLDISTGTWTKIQYPVEMSKSSSSGRMPVTFETCPFVHSMFIHGVFIHCRSIAPLLKRLWLIMYFPTVPRLPPSALLGSTFCRSQLLWHKWYVALASLPLASLVTSETKQTWEMCPSPLLPVHSRSTHPATTAPTLIALT